MERLNLTCQVAVRYSACATVPVTHPLIIGSV
uniref:Uncharacterized protein n=1 Tax=Anguilla anguilla TaxID=7936 RepID=A0A0E9QHM0_ANGAN